MVTGLVFTHRAYAKGLWAGSSKRPPPWEKRRAPATDRLGTGTGSAAV